MKRSNKRSLYCGPKGKFVIPKTTLSLRKALAPNMAAARAALRCRGEETVEVASISTLTPQSIGSNNYCRSSISTLRNERTHYRKRGSSIHEFVDDKKDWRSFGSCTFNDMKNYGYFSILTKKITTYNCARL